MSTSNQIKKVSKEMSIAATQSLKEREYWLNKLHGELVQSCFLYDNLEKDINKPTMAVKAFRLTGELFSRLIGISNNVDSTLHIVLVAGVTFLLNRYTDKNDIIVATSIDKQDIEGEFINTMLPLRSRVDDGMTFKDLLLQIKDTILEAIEHQNYPIEILLHDELGISFEDDSPLFDVAVLLENIQNKNYIKHINFNLVFSFFKTDEYIAGSVQYNLARYNQNTIDRIITHFTSLVQKSLSNIDLKLTETTILSEEERKQLLADFNDTETDKYPGKTLYRLLEEQAEKVPDNPAVKYIDKELTYNNLNKNANRTAQLLKHHGLGKEQTVGILFDRSPRMVESILAVWKTGGAYIPLDPQYPPQRLKEILVDSGMKILLTTAEYVKKGEEANHNRAMIIRLDDEDYKGNAADLGPGADIHSLAYVIYTSGSTGRPKGAMVEHIGMINHIWAKIEYLQLTNTSIVAQNAPHTFDISIWQFFAGLVSGGKTVIYPNPLVLDPEQFSSRIVEDHITILEVVPSYLSVLLDSLDWKFKTLESLKYLLVTGETVKPILVERWFEKYPGIKMVNAYGPTEASDDITHYIMEKPPEMDRIPIGRPLRNFKIYILNENMGLCPIGVKGEICVSGIGVGRGYLNDAAKTEAVFMADPFVEKKGTRLYKTGDMGRWLEGGIIEFFGRKDSQVKIRGFRIELEEIESKLAEHPDVKDVVVIDREDEKKNKYLCAYIVFGPGGRLKVACLKEYLEKKLPDYMMPTHFLKIGELPLTPNGKVNRKSLPEPELNQFSSMTYISEKMLEDSKATADKDIYVLSEEQVSKFSRNIALLSETEETILKKYSDLAGKPCYPLTHSQKMIYYNEKRFAGTSCENLIYIIKYSKILEKELFKKAVNKVLMKNDAFRLRIVEAEHESTILPGQYIADYEEYTPDFYDFSGKDDPNTLEEWIETNNKKTFEFEGGRLYYFAHIKLNESVSWYYMKFHHIVSDGWTTFLAAREIDQIYNALETGEPVKDTPNPSYLPYISDEKRYLHSQQMRNDMTFWHNNLHPLPEPVSLSYKKGDPLNIEGETAVLPFPPILRTKMHEACKVNRTSLFKLLLSTLSIYVAHITGSDDFVMGTLNHNRSSESYRNTAGTFIRFLPLRIHTDQNNEFCHFVRETGKNVDYILKHHQKYPFDFLINEIRERTGVDPGYFYNINLVGHPDFREANFKLSHYFPAYEPVQLSIHINFSNKDIDGILELEWDYQRERFSYRDIERIHQGLINILHDATANPQKKLLELEILSEEEKKQILYEFANMDLSFPLEPGIREIFEKPVHYILNKNYMLQPIGVPGELYIGGGCMIESPVSNAKHIKERLIPDPFSKRGMLYKSGELAMRLPNGDLEFMGQIDDRLQVRETNIDTELIESALLKLDNVTEAVVVRKKAGTVITSGDSRNDLCAYVVAEIKLREFELKEYLTKKLHHYMVPSYFVQLEKMPLTTGGRTDIELLEAMVVYIDSAYIAPGNEKEEKLAKVWSEVLAVDKVGVDENFFSLGGDSIKAIQIVARLKTYGLKLELRNLFEYHTIKELSPLIVEIKQPVDQESVEGNVFLNQAQKWLFSGEVTEIHHFNQSVMLYFEEGCEERAVRNVFAKLQEHHDALRMSYKELNGEVIQINHGLDCPLSLQIYDLRNQPDREKALGLLEARANDLQASINLETGPLMKLGLFHLNDGDHLLIVIHHLVVDTVSWRILLEDIDTLYRQYTKGTPFTLPLKTNSFQLWAEMISEYANSESFLKEKSYWAQLELSEVPVIKKDFEVGDNYVKDTDSLSFTLEETQTELLLTKVNEAFGTEINDILLTALGLGFKRIFKCEKLWIDLECHGREEIIKDVDIKRTVGWFTAAYPLFLVLSHENNLSRQIKEVKESLRHVPNKGIGYGILKYLTSKEYKAELDLRLKSQIVFNYLGQFDTDVEQKSFKIAKESCGEMQSASDRRPYEFDVMGTIIGRQLRITITYSKKQYKKETVKKLLSTYKSKLSEIISYCVGRKRELTPSDLTYKGFSLDDLEQLTAKYPVKNIYPLTSMQEGMFFYHLYDKFSFAYFEQISYRVHGDLNIPYVEKSLNELLKRHDILRTVFIRKKMSRCLQVVLKERKIDFLYEDISKRDEKDKNEYLIQFKERDKKRSFDLSNDVLIRVSIFKTDNAEHEFTWSFHHILMDGWCIGILNIEFLEIYTSYLENKPYQLPAVKPYRTYIQWLEKQDKEASLRYWENYLDSFEEQTGVLKTGIIDINKRENEPGYSIETVSFVLNREKTSMLNKSAAGRHVTLNTMVQTIWGILLGKYNGKEDVVFGAVVSGRPSGIDGVETMVGLFINTIPVRIRWEEGTACNELLQQVQKAAIDSEPHHYSPLAEIQSKSALKQNLLDHILIFENYPIAEELYEKMDRRSKKNERVKLELSGVDVFEQTNYDFNLTIRPGEKFTIRFDYNANVYEGKWIKEVANHLSELFRQILENEEILISELTLLSREEKKKILYDFNDTDEEYPQDKTIHKLFEEQVERNPENMAVIGQSAKRKAQSAEERRAPCAMRCALTYKELNEKSNHLAYVLKEKGLSPDTIVGIMLERSIEMIIGILGILKSGGAYLSIDPDYPEERIKYMLSDSQAKILLTTKNIANAIEFDKEVIHLDSPWQSMSLNLSEGRHPDFLTSQLPSFPASLPSNLAYIIYTSGTAGKPKGVMIQHRSVIRLVKNTNFIEWETGDRLLPNGSIAFDISTFETWAPLLNGAALVLVDKETILNDREFERVIQVHKVTHLHLIPQLFAQLAEQRPTIFHDLRYFLVGGDLVRPREVNEIRRKYRHLIILHMYGPTENTTFSTFFPVEREYEDWLPIGRPIANSTVYILDKYGHLQPIGVYGELCTGGIGVARGYLNNPELTIEKFIEFDVEEGKTQKNTKKLSPHLPTQSLAYSTIYRTGDLARWLSDGNIEFLGRVDHQVKIRGIRIEPGEIENQLLQHEEINDAVVSQRKKEDGEVYLCAYVVTQLELSTVELKEYLAGELPAYMIPSYFIRVEKIPLTPNGKVDQKVLQSLDINPNTGTEYAAPENDTEELIAAAWKEFLIIDDVGVNDNFFDVGGHSLNIIQVNSRLKNIFQKDIPIVEMFRYPTIRSLAQYLDNKEKEFISEEKIERDLGIMEEAAAFFLGDENDQ